jgi:murein DD-endopeptidase MepM/ murein hydrolase activator NlpD
MASHKYYYNPKTLRYELARFPWATWFFRVSGVAIMSCLFFYGLLLLVNRFTESELEHRLRTENKALKNHRGTVEQELKNSRVALASLSGKDKEIYQRIFLNAKTAEVDDAGDAEDILQTDLAGFHQVADQLINKTDVTQAKASLASWNFAQLFWPTKEDVSELQQYPTLIPISDFKLSQFVCGFGEQLNPFNKLLYHHEGVDLEAELGAPVLAAGDGRVVMAVRQTTPYGEGNYIEIEHINGYRTRYEHLAEVSVHRGQQVKQGQVIAEVGMTGEATAPHLHYMVMKNGNPINPILFFTEQIDERSWIQLAEISKQVKQALD